MNLQEAKILLEKHGANGIRDLLYKFKEISPNKLHTLNPEEYSIQAKWDGWFTATLVENGIGTMYSRTKKYRENLDCNGLNNNIYIGELIENTAWSYEFCHGSYHGKLVIFNRLIENLIELEYIDIIGPEWIDRIITYTSNDLKKTFDEIIAQGYEGMILINKKTGERIKVKKIVEDDFEILGFEISKSDTAKRAGGMVKNFIYGKQKKLIGKCCGMTDKMKKDMFHNPDKYLGRIAILRGKERFKSGCLRHPNFWDWRNEADKKVL